MFAVIFEVQPKSDRWEQYLDLAGLLRPELVQIRGFLENERFRSRRTEGRVLSLSIWADEKAVMEAAAKGDALADKTLDRFCGFLGAVAGDLALTFGARGGVFVSGGIAPRMADRLNSGTFRARFEDKGRLRAYMEPIPTSLVLHPYPAIIGAARELEMMERL